MASPRSRNTAFKLELSGLRKTRGRIDRFISRYDDAAVLAESSLRRKALPIARAAIQTEFSIDSSTIKNSRGQAGIRIDTGGTKKKEYISIFASTQRIPLIAFSGQWGGRSTVGASAQIERGLTKIYAGAFIAPGRLQGKQAKLIYKRGGKKRIQKYGRYKGKLRQPIRALKGPSPFNMLSPADNALPGALRARKKVITDMTEFYLSELRRQIARGK